MKKKALLVAVVTALVVALSGCGQTGGSKSTKAEKDGVYFKNGVYETNDVKIEITDEKVIQPGETGNEYGEKPVIAFWYKVTNKTEKDTDPTTAWITAFQVFQDNDANQVNELDVGMLPDQRYTDTQMETIKKGGTAENAIAYELDDTTTPVIIKASNFVTGEKIGQKKYEIV